MADASENILSDVGVYQRTPDDLVSITRRLAGLSRSELPEVGQGILIYNFFFLLFLKSFLFQGA